jgi:hypothetical protein
MELTMAERQFVACKFRPGDRRAYTYHWDGEPHIPGEKVKAPDKSGNGWSAVVVESVSWANPPFATKAILGKVEEAPAAPSGELPL